MNPTVAQEGASGDTSLAPGLLPAQRSRCDISLQPWRDVLQEGRAGAMLSAGMRMERGPRLPDPLRVARVAPCPYPANQDADTGEIPLRLHGKVQDVCCVQHWRQMLGGTCCRDPEQTALSLRASTERMLTHHLSCSFLQSQGSVTFGSAASAWHFQSPNLFSLSSPKCSGHIVLGI